MEVRRRLPLLLLLLLAAAVARCGDRPEAIDRSTHARVFAASMAAIHRADLEALWPLLTQRGREGVERELRAWQARLRDPREGPTILALVRQRQPDLPDEAFERAARGSLSEIARFLFTVDPRPPDPVQRGVEVDPGGRRVVVLFDCPSGEQTKVVRAVLVRQASGWYLDELQL